MIFAKTRTKKTEGIFTAFALLSCLGLCFGQSADKSPRTGEGSQDLPSSGLSRPKQLPDDPIDSEIWARKLEQQQITAQALKKDDEEAKSSHRSDPLLTLMRINNHQLQGISLRHLKRYEEALAELRLSDELIRSFRSEHRCDDPAGKSPRCQQVNEEYYLQLLFFSNVYSDLKDDTNVEKYLQLALAAATGRNYRESLSMLVSWYTDRDKYETALDTAYRALDGGSTNTRIDAIEVASNALEFIYAKLFRSISWQNRATERRSNDARDFVDNHGIGIGRTSKYGMENVREDYATFATIFYLQEVTLSRDRESEEELDPESTPLFGYGSREELRRNVDIERYVREQLVDDNFEPAAKYLYFKYIHNSFTPGMPRYMRHSPTVPPMVSFAEVLTKLSAAPSVRVDPNTKRIIEALYRADQFLASQDSKR